MPSVREALPAGDVPPPSAQCAAPPSGPRRFGVAILAVGVMVGVRIVLNPLLGHHGPFLLFTPAVMLAAWYGNATKFTPKGGRIEMRLQRAKGTARLEVSDTGDGIAPQFLPHVFEPFRKGQHSSAGLRLGLSIVRHIVGMHDGTVTAESPGVGRGTSFVLTFPLVRASASTLPSLSRNLRPSA